MLFDMVSLEMLHYIIVIAVPVRAFSFQRACSSLQSKLFSFCPLALGSFKYTKGCAPWAKIPALQRHYEPGKDQWLCWNTERINVTSSIPPPPLKSRTDSGIPNIWFLSFMPDALFVWWWALYDYNWHCTMSGMCTVDVFSDM